MATLKSPYASPSVSAGTSIRRKPIFTYQSPAAHISTLYLDKRPLRGTPSPSVSSPSPSSSLAPNSTTEPHTPPSSITTLNRDLTHRLTFTTVKASSSSPPSYKHPRMSTLLPLYHPFGPLALSLPDLDPTTFGLPAPHVAVGGLGIGISGIFDDPEAASHLRSSNRSRRPAVKLRDATDDTTGAGVSVGASPALVDVTPVPESEAPVKPSPRKRRNGGSGNKRKRKDAEDGDATYPAKRVRNPRSSALASSIPIAGPSTPGPEETQTSPPTEGGGNEKTRPGRRSTRARGQAVRRDSTASEATVTSASVSLAATGTAAGNTGGDVETEEPPSAPMSSSSNSNVVDGVEALASITATAEPSSREGGSEEPLEKKES
ncbi:hypothetical protein V8B97DRAFT_716091 [Scleroderma yunnanense]